MTIVEWDVSRPPEFSVRFGVNTPNTITPPFPPAINNRLALWNKLGVARVILASYIYSKRYISTYTSVLYISLYYTTKK